MKILEELYHGNIRPSEQCVKRNSEYDRLRVEWLRLYEIFTKKYSEDEIKNFNELNDLQSHMAEIVAVENYMQGFRHGAKMILDVLFGESENLK